MTGLAEPPHLAEFLATGCDLTQVPGLRLDLLVDSIDTAPGETTRWVRWYREQVACWLAGEPDEIDSLRAGPPRHHTQAEVCEFAWAADALEAPALARAVRRAVRRAAR